MSKKETSPSLPAETKNVFLFWASVVVLLGLFVWFFKGILLPFVLGMAIAYLLDPLVEWLNRHKISRIFATILILVIFFSCVFALLAVTLPFLYRELVQLANNAPALIDKVWNALPVVKDWVVAHVGEDSIGAMQNVLQNNVGKAFEVSSRFVAGLASGGQAILDLLSFLIITPIVAFFTIWEWPKITKWIDDLFPRAGHADLRTILSAIDKKVAGFVRGQISIAVLLGLVYATALVAVGLNYGFLIGFVAGVLSIIPLVGSSVGLVVSIAMAWVQTQDPAFVGLVAGIFIVGQVVEGNILTPKLLGDSVGMHPLWMIFALMAGGHVMGVVGMLLAVPVAASLGVVIAYMIEKYKNSSYYAAKTGKVKAS